MADRRPAFDRRGPFVARQTMLVAGVWVQAGSAIDTTSVPNRLLEILFRARRIDFASDARPSSAAVVPGAGSGRVDPLPADPVGRADSDQTAESPAVEPSRLAALPDGWRDMHGNKLRALARSIVGATPATKDEAVMLLEGYERARAA